MSRPAQFTPEEIKVRRNARRVEYQRRKMAEDPAYREKQKAMWRDWYSRNKDELRDKLRNIVRKPIRRGIFCRMSVTTQSVGSTNFRWSMRT